MYSPILSLCMILYNRVINTRFTIQDTCMFNETIISRNNNFFRLICEITDIWPNMPLVIQSWWGSQVDTHFLYEHVNCHRSTVWFLHEYNGHFLKDIVPNVKYPIIHVPFGCVIYFLQTPCIYFTTWKSESPLFWKWQSSRYHFVQTMFRWTQ